MFPREDLRRALALYAVTDRAWLGERTLAACVEEALGGGATFVQLREKDAPRAEEGPVSYTDLTLPTILLV